MVIRHRDLAVFEMQSLRGICIYSRTKYWSGRKGMFIHISIMFEVRSWDHTSCQSVNERQAPNFNSILQ